MIKNGTSPIRQSVHKYYSIRVKKLPSKRKVIVGSAHETGNRGIVKKVGSGVRDKEMSWRPSEAEGYFEMD